MAVALFADFLDKLAMPDWLFYTLIGVAVLLIVAFVAMRMMRKPSDD